MMDDHTPPGGAGEEQALRSLLRGAVEGLEPSEGALERLRYAVPVRRTRKRQALVGAAAAVLLAGTAIPAALHLHITGGEGSAADHSAMAGHGEEPGATAGGSTSDPHQNGPGSPSKSAEAAGKGVETGGAGVHQDQEYGGSPTGGGTEGPATAGASAGASAGTGPMPPAAATGLPGCSAEQLGVQGSAKAPEADGKVYGSFKVTNVSARGCTVVGPDTVTAASVTASAPGQGSGVSVVGHTAGDPAAGLPDPSAETPLLLLQPHTAYEVRFAWVPSAQSCPAASPDPGPKPPVDGAQDTGQRAPDTAAAAGPEPDTGRTAPDTGVEVTHTPNTALPGAPTTQTKIPAACGGTVYRTGVIPLDAPKP
ncbi:MULTISPECIES: hypothetical protein [unclassified Streptomyces]|uniref:DUF4232 domain-containing protein n=1 Tax=Streptomyces sp. R33 TaxID=3238629 RepID=A0AB39Y5W1_9ACTN|nr:MULTISPECIES: hypothetical protein [unclassified Streptomyces]TDU76923.1 hypothetical protein EDD91_3646 [Streptomyces sp. KS 21]THA38499.1 hypothetical protein E6W17_15950 [Streptomyces sp. A1547]